MSKSWDGATRGSASAEQAERHGALTTGHTWARAGTRALLWDEPPQGRWLNLLGALASCGATPGLVWTCTGGKLDGAALLGFLGRRVIRLPAPPEQPPAGCRRARRCVIVLDMASAHVNKAVRAALPALAAAEGTLYHLPPKRPEPDRIEELWRHAKHEELPVRSHRTLEDLRAAVERALDHHRSHLRGGTANVRKAA